jgi:hypothetical protein
MLLAVSLNIKARGVLYILLLLGNIHIFFHKESPEIMIMEGL